MGVTTFLQEDVFLLRFLPDNPLSPVGSSILAHLFFPLADRFLKQVINCHSRLAIIMP